MNVRHLEFAELLSDFLQSIIQLLLFVVASLRLLLQVEFSLEHFLLRGLSELERHLMVLFEESAL